MPKKQEQIEGVDDKRASRFDYNRTAFLLKEPYSQFVADGPYHLKDREDHKRLLGLAKEKHLYVWYANVIESNGSLLVVEPHLIDWESVPDEPYPYTLKVAPPIERQPHDLKCPKCGQQCSSPSGYTLHVKAHDRDEEERAERYPADLRCQVCGHKCHSTSGYTLHMKSHSAPDDAAEAGQDDSLKCPHCDKRCSSTSGLTLHIKHQHGEETT